MTSKSYLNLLTVLHASLIMGQLLFLVLIYFLINAGKEPLPGVAASAQTEVYIIGSIMIMCVLASSQIFGMRVRHLQTRSELSEKLNGYRTIFIVRLALLEAPSLLAMVFYMISNNLLLLLFSGMIILLQLILRPTKYRIKQDLALSPAEQALLDNPDAALFS
ncbi:MAG TPA: hypothetical protein PKD70_11875 [Saprospiraceae bacterium]|nr:hypothetical protein [Saprospiraceae bacterium]HMP14571.1 hypothetical protein [Saprospiraceae bacterium]